MPLEMNIQWVSMIKMISFNYIFKYNFSKVNLPLQKLFSITRKTISKLCLHLCIWIFQKI